MEELSGAAILADCLRSWRRGPYPSSASFVSAMASGEGDGEPRWIHDVQNLVDLYEAMETLTWRQIEILERYVVYGYTQARIASDMQIHQSSVSTELELSLKSLIPVLGNIPIKNSPF